MIGATSLNPALRVSRWLEFEHLKLTGVISYSIYLWQGVFLRPNWGIFGLFLLPLAAFGSWYFVERKGIAFGHALTKLSLRSSSVRAACQEWLAQVVRRSQPRTDRVSG
jgi:peptidoglycan/LPS O-acetylase OafA/YrhL